MKITAVVQRGRNTGKLLFPHRYADGTYVISETRFEKDYKRVYSIAEAVEWVKRGYRLRMSNPAEKISPSLIQPSSISIS